LAASITVYAAMFAGAACRAQASHTGHAQVLFLPDQQLCPWIFRDSHAAASLRCSRLHKPFSCTIFAVLFISLPRARI